MHDRWEYTIPAGTAEADAIKVKCPISPGILTDIVIFFPAGCWGYARCRVLLGEKPIVPRSLGNFIAADDGPYPVHGMNEPISEDLPVLNWYVWNVDDTYDHTIWMRADWLGIKTAYEKLIYLKLAEFVRIMKRLTGVK